MSTGNNTDINKGLIWNARIIGGILMSKRKTGAIPVNAPKEKKKMVIDMNHVNLAKSYQQPGFRTGRHMTEKDRPRKKNWKKDYYGDPGSGSFSYVCIFVNSSMH